MQPHLQGRADGAEQDLATEEGAVAAGHPRLSQSQQLLCISSVTSTRDSASLSLLLFSFCRVGRDSGCMLPPGLKLEGQGNDGH